jgi:hypothetical protein
MFDFVEVVTRAASAARVARRVNRLPGLRIPEVDAVDEGLAPIRRRMTLEKLKAASDPVAAQPQPDRTDDGDADTDTDPGVDMSTVDDGGFLAGIVDWITDHF